MFKLIQNSVLAIITIVLLNGCAVTQIGHTIGNSVQGDYYLNNGEYKTGLEIFEQKVKENPDNATANYYYGRFLLHNNSAKTSLKYLKKATTLNPDSSEYLFWQGVNYAELGDLKSEERLYRKALAINSRHLLSLVYLGHNLFERKKYKDALEQYTKAIEIYSKQKSSLYNRALVNKKLNRTPEEIESWKTYLQYYPYDSQARVAANNLLLLKDFSYRSYYLGSRSITIPTIRFEPFSSELTRNSKNSLNTIGRITSGIKKGTLQILVYQENNKELAKSRALAIKKYLLDKHSSLSTKRIGVSWFATPQHLKVSRKKIRIDESIDFFITAK